MGQGQKTNRIIVPQARAAMEKFKQESATEIGLNVSEGYYWGDIPSRQCGAVGGHMVRKMIQDYEQRLGGQAQANAANVLR
ncbi:MAG: alpha/beta-type small acid-soluble spore protein [Clostridia bacterium]|nr:MAG: alpha/beta-type small acid-soluble spore protein [Clostridia bacterium]